MPNCVKASRTRSCVTRDAKRMTPGYVSLQVKTYLKTGSLVAASLMANPMMANHWRSWRDEGILEHRELGGGLVDGIPGDGDHGETPVVELLELHGALVHVRALEESQWVEA
jgi:hypothetical protein